jgi:hypothetical protein
MIPRPYSSRVLALCEPTFRGGCTKGASGTVTLAGLASIGWVASVNFIIDSDHRWLLLALAALWGAALALCWLEGGGGRRTTDA